MSKVSNCCGVSGNEDSGICPYCFEPCEYIDQFPPNPFLIHRIQDAMWKVSDRTLFGAAVLKGVMSGNVKSGIVMIADQVRDNKLLVIDCIGEDLVEMVEEYTASAPELLTPKPQTNG